MLKCKVNKEDSLFPNNDNILQDITNTVSNKPSSSFGKIVENKPYDRKDGDEEEEEEPKDLSCPMYNKETKECLIYDNRPLSCRTYPLEFDGQKYMVVDTEDCEGIGNGETTNEERKEMRDLAKSMNVKLTEMRISMPILAQAFQPFVLNEIMDAQKRYMEAMEKMSPEEREKVEQQMKERMEQDQSGSKVDVDNPTEDADATK